MEWLSELWSGESVAHTVLILSLVAVAGLMLGNLKIKGVGLGIAGVLFSGLIFAHFGVGINKETLEFLREFGLILFVYSIGTQVGPSFLSSLKKQGLALNAMAASIVLLGAVITVAVAKLAHIPFPVAAGLFSGATTNTPSLAAGTEALKGLPPEAFTGIGVAADEASKMPALGYAVAYPFGILGIIMTMFLIKALFKVDVASESKAIEAQRTSKAPPLQARSVQVHNTELEGVSVGDVATLASSNVVVSRVMRNGSVAVAEPEKKLQPGDVVVGVGTDEELARFERLLGGPAEVDVKSLPSDVETRRVVVTQEKVSGKTLEELGLLDRSGVVITRVRRMELEFTPKPDFKLQLGDSILAVGESKNLNTIAQELGDAPAQLDHPRVIPLFLGIGLGVLLGSIPVPIPGVPVGVKLGLAGGPLLVSLILSAMKRVGPLNFYMPKSANFALREVGIVLFMACVGLKSGGSFVSTLTQGDGFLWMAYGALITAIPLLVVALAARAIWKLNYASLCGLLSGSMTDPPALAFAGAMTNSEAPSLSYATVYPLVMLMRVVTAQLLILFFLR